jgi:hypothetical protein
VPLRVGIFLIWLEMMVQDVSFQPLASILLRKGFAKYDQKITLPIRRNPAGMTMFIQEYFFAFDWFTDMSSTSFLFSVRAISSNNVVNFRIVGISAGPSASKDAGDPTLTSTVLPEALYCLAEMPYS